MHTKESTSVDPNRSFFLAAAESKACNTVLLTAFVALLIIGILASVGIFEFMGTASAAHLSYGMYAAAFAVCVSTIIKCVVTNRLCKQTTNNTPKHGSTPLAPDEIINLKQGVGLFASSDKLFTRQDGSYVQGFLTPEAREKGKESLYNMILQLIDHPDFQNDPDSFMDTLRLELHNQGTSFLKAYAFWYLLNKVNRIRTLPDTKDLVYWGFQVQNS